MENTKAVPMTSIHALFPLIRKITFSLPTTVNLLLYSDAPLKGNSAIILEVCELNLLRRNQDERSEQIAEKTWTCILGTRSSDFPSIFVEV